MNIRSTIRLALVAVVAVSASTSPAAQTQTTKPTPAPKAGTTKPAPKAATVQPAPKAGTAKPAAKAAAPATTTASKAILRNVARLKDVAPATYKAAFSTTAGDFVIEVQRAWAPKGADRFYNLVKYGYFDATRFFRVMPNFMVQFGINGDPTIQKHWQEAVITDDPVTQSNKRGYISFATRGPGSRTTQVFINFRDNASLDPQGFAPFGQVISGMEVVDKINAEYRQQPDQGRIQAEGNRYLTQAFPRLDFVKSATIVK